MRFLKGITQSRASCIIVHLLPLLFSNKHTAPKQSSTTAPREFNLGQEI